MKIRILQVLLLLALVCPVRIAFAGAGDKSKDLSAEIESLKAQIAQITHQIQDSQDVFAINNLEDAYGYYVDKAKWDEVADLFTKDGTLEIGLRGVYTGQDRVRAYLHKLPDLKYGSV